MGKFEEWTVAYRRRNGKTILDDTESPFTVIKNNWRYWAADPHVFEYKDKTYVFAELYDRILRRGVIGYSIINDSGNTQWKVVIKRPWHLSYPHIFVRNNEIYMIPESYVGEQIELLRAVDFPDKWENAKILKKNYVSVDTTIVTWQGKDYLQTLEFKNNNDYLQLFSFENMQLSDNCHLIAENDPNKRPAGHVFEYNSHMIRPAQDCTESYGCALNLYNIVEIGDDLYIEELLKKIYPEDIKSNFNKAPQGIHTYNFSNQYEVIDLKSYEKDYWSPIVRPIWYIWRRIKKVL